jgi:DNA primase
LSQDISIVEQIKDKANIVDVVGRLIPLKRGGKSWAGLCPFHTDTDASFHVYEDGQHFHCYGCGAHGDIISFYEMHYHLDFIEARDRLAGEYGIDIQPGGVYKADKSKDILFEVNSIAGKVYYDAIKEEGNPALDYLLNRGIDRKAIQKFRIGYADNSGRMLSERLENNPEMLKAAEEVGLVYRQGGRCRDKFSGRVMFPIINTRNKVIGFGGRDISGTAKAKYVNSDASKIFIKGSNLYGLNITKGDIHDQGFAILVEGYMDLVALYMFGVTNVCAQLGTAFTSDQARLLRNFKNVVLALDSDESGQKAAEKTMGILADEGLKVRVLVFAGAKDPDDFIRTFGRDAFEQEIRNAKPMYDFKIDRMKKGFDLSVSDGLADFLKEAAKLIATMSPVEQEQYIKKLSRETGISESAIAMQAQAGALQTPAVQAQNETPEQTAGNTDELLCGILALALGSGYVLEKAADYRYMFDGTSFGGIMNAMLVVKERSGTAPTASELSEMLDEADQTVLDQVVRKMRSKHDDTYEEQIDEYLIKLELTELGAREKSFKDAMTMDSGDSEGLDLKELMEIQNRIKKLKNELRNMKRGD